MLDFQHRIKKERKSKGKKCTLKAKKAVVESVHRH